MFKTIKGRVTSNVDAQQSGRFQAIFDVLSSEPVEVIYASPGYRLGGGGMFFIPEKGDTILAVQDVKTKEIYYQTTIVNVQGPVYARPVPDFKEVPDLNGYNYYSKPVKVKYENQKGFGLCITSEYTSYDEAVLAPRIIDSVSLTTPLRKKISLDDSPEVDAISIKNQHKDGIIVTGNRTKTFPAQMIQLKSSGPHNYTCMQSHMKMEVVEGTDITVENTSTGKMGQTPSEDQWPNGSQQQPPKRWGGVYLRSVNGDVSLASNAEDGRVFITTPNAQIQIVEADNGEGSDIIVRTNGSISMESEGDIDMRSTNGSIKLQAAGDVDVTAGGLLKTSSSDKTSISSGKDTAINANGNNILLNSGGSESPAPANPKQSLFNDYGD
jgi:hypothetical protein